MSFFTDQEGWSAGGAPMPDPDNGQTQIPIDELVALAAHDDELFYTSFFPKTFRMPSAPKHRDMDRAMNDPTARLVNLRAFRGSSKTTRMRAHTAKRIAYGLSRTALYVGASEPHASRSIQWLRSQIKGNTLFRTTFGLRMGRKDNDTELEIIHEKLEHSIWILGVGITGNIRGINFDDYRPDLILLDDPLTDETAATAEQRNKMRNLIHGALKNSLAPTTEAPNAKLILAQTPIAKEDAADEAAHSGAWTTVEFSCWTDETKDLPVDEQISSWPVRFPTEELRTDKRLAAAENRLSTWQREWEVRLGSPETSSFKVAWLVFRKTLPPPMPTICIVDPVPPPTASALAKGLHRKDYEAIGVMGGPIDGQYHVLDYKQMRGHEPNWTTGTILEYYQRYHFQRLVMMPVGYEMALEYIIRQAMQRSGLYFMIKTLPRGKLSKFHFITGRVSGIASHRKLVLDGNMTDLISQYEQYPDVPHDDLLDMLAVGLTDLVNPYLELSANQQSALERVTDFDIDPAGRAP